MLNGDPNSSCCVGKGVVALQLQGKQSAAAAGRRHQGQGRKEDLSFPSIYLNTNNTKALQELGRGQIIINNFIQSRQISVLPQSRCS